VRSLWSKAPVLGLTAEENVPDHPGGPAIACRMKLTDKAVEMVLNASHPSGSDWVPIARFRMDPVKLATDNTSTGARASSDKEFAAVQLGDALADGMVSHLIRLSVARGPRVKGKETLRIKIINDSPLILNGLAVGGKGAPEGATPSVLLV
jgi:hypothetical protein